MTSVELSEDGREYVSRQIRVSEVQVRDELNGRLELDEAGLEWLVGSIRKHGQLTPITVRMVDGGYELIAGRRRLEAMTRMRSDFVRAEVVCATDAGASVLRLAENCVRQSLSPVEVALQLGGLLEVLDNDVDRVAEAVGRRVEWVLDRLEIADWSSELAEAVHMGRVSLGAARQLHRIADPDRQTELVALAGSTGLSVRQAGRWREQCEAEARYGAGVVGSDVRAPLTEFVSRTEVECFVCRERQDIVETRSTWVCLRCLSGLEQRRGGADPEALIV